MAENNEGADEKAVPVTETPEFQMALAAATTRIADDLRAEMKTIMAGAVSKGAGDSDALSMARMIASSIAQMADQGTGRKTVAPEILEARRMAQEEMGRLLMAARELPKGDRPRYRLTAKLYAKDRVVDPYHRDSRTKQLVPTEVIFMSVPNLAMRPLNPTAKAIFKAFMGMANNGQSEVMQDFKPVWVTDSGVIVAGTPPQTKSAHGGELDIDYSFDDDLMSDIPNPVGQGEGDDNLGIITQDDPRRDTIHTLGTIAPPARRTMSKENIA